MATQESLDLVQYAYIAFYGRPADKAGQEWWAEQLDANGGDLSAIIDAFSTSPEYDAQYGDLTNVELVEALYEQILGRPADEAGRDWYVAELEAGNITKGGIAIAIMNGPLYNPEAAADDAATLANRKAIADEFTAAVESADKAYGEDQLAAAKALLSAVDKDTVVEDVNVDGTVASFPAAEEPTGPGAEGETFQLTDGRDVLTGTDGDDTFIGLVGQNQNGAVANAFATGDMIDGGAGRDTIVASLTNDYSLGAVTNDDVYGNAVNVAAPRPITNSVEEVFIEALATSGTIDYRDPLIANDVILDATRMEGVEEFWSDFSRDDLTIAGINLRGSNLDITKDVTFGIKDTMHGTDFTALFDSLSLIRESASQSNSQLLVRIADVSTEAPDTPLANVNLNLSFELGEVTIDLENIQSTDGTYAGLVEAIQDALALQGYAGLTVELSTPYTEVTFAGNTVTLPFTAQEILVTDPAGNSFDNVSFTQSAIEPVAGGFLVAGNAQPLPPGTSSNLIESNLVLDNAGNGSLAGDVVIGGMSNSDLGVERFNVTVDRDSKINSLNTTNGALQEIHIGSMGVNGDLFIGATQAELNEIDANAFVGENLSLGEVVAVQNLDFLDASGTAANITFEANYNGDARASADQGFVINTGSGNDNITAVVDGTSTSLSTLTSLTVSSTGGDNTVTLSDADTSGSTGKVVEVNSATVTLGAGNDTVTGGALNLTANTGAGDDVIYAENTGAKTIATVNAGVWSAAAGNTAMGNSTNVAEEQLLYGRDVRVTLSLPSDGASNVADSFVDGLEAVASITASNGYLTTERDLYEAVAKAINEDAVLSKLASAAVDSNGHLTVKYQIDGLSVVAENVVQFEVLGDWADLSTAAQNNIVDALKNEYNDSTIDAADAAVGYNDADAAIGSVAVSTAGADSLLNGGTNIVNAGLGNDVIVLSSDDTTVDTVVFDGQFGTNTIVHFDAANDVLDFSAWLNNTLSASGSVESQVRVPGTAVDLTTSAGAFGENQVAVTTFTVLDGVATATLAFNTLSADQVKVALNEAGDFTSTAGTVDGTTQHSILMVENVDNLGEYKVFQVASDEAAGDNFTTVTLVGTVDFGETVTVVDANIL